MEPTPEPRQFYEAYRRTLGLAQITDTRANAVPHMVHNTKTPGGRSLGAQLLTFRF